MNLSGMRKAGLTPAIMGLHLAFIFEYAFTKVRCLCVFCVCVSERE